MKSLKENINNKESHCDQFLFNGTMILVQCFLDDVEKVNRKRGYKDGREEVEGYLEYKMTCGSPARQQRLSRYTVP